jgi:hypothetical protein
MGRTREFGKHGVAMGWSAAMAVALAAGLASGVRAQEAQPASPPSEPPAGAGAESAGVAVKADAPAAAPQEDPSKLMTSDGEAYPISRVLLVYARENPGQPDVQDERFQNLTVRLGKLPEGYVNPRPGVESVSLKLSEITEGSGGIFRKERGRRDRGVGAGGIEPSRGLRRVRQPQRRGHRRADRQGQTRGGGRPWSSSSTPRW